MSRYRKSKSLEDARLDELLDVAVADPTDNDVISWDSITKRWINGPPTDVSASGGDYTDGGDTKDKNRTLGNKDAYSLGLLTNNTQRIHIKSDGKVGIGVTGNDVTNTLTLPNNSSTGVAKAYAWSTYSSQRYKREVQDIEGALSSVLSLKGVNFTWKEGNRNSDFGFIAEDVFEVIPEVVVKDSKGNPDGLDYSRLTPFLVEAIKEQHGLIAALYKKVVTLEKEVEEIKHNKFRALLKKLVMF